MSVAEVTTSRDGIWLTAMLRPAGELAGRAIERFIEDLVDLAQRANIVVVNLVAATVPAPAALARALRRPGRCSPVRTSACCWWEPTRRCCVNCAGSGATSPRCPIPAASGA